MIDDWINLSRGLILLCCAPLAGCDAQSVPATPAQYEQAKADCAPHGGLASVNLVYVTFRSDRVDAVCLNKVRLSRDSAPAATQEPHHD